jgi:AbrB family looped-hinge helix DNA binding protein
MSTESQDETATRVTDKGQTTIPKALREKYGIKPGDTVVWEDTGEEIVVKKVVSDAGRGMLFDDDVPEETREEIVKKMTDEIREKRETEWAVE